MANTSSTHTIDVKTNIPKATKEAEGLNAALSKAAATAKRVPTPVAAARQAKNLDAGAELGRESGIARSIGPGTGASGRDFAKQSEGLGGLVRVYATFAANIFAATAAFGALSRAADTTNLVKGLDQLGAASGRNLGSLSKQLVSAADGAISLRDAMTSVAQASAGGMSNSNIVKMAEVAKRASQALGRDMPDALNRLTRGITKLEPELLDEIGIMVRLDTTTQDYAKSVGKSVTALTMFEKRQAFANAVLAQGAEKFGQIELASNPYSKLLASSQNILQSGLEVINTVLSPLLGFLSSSPTGLALAIAGLATMLLRQALPAISKWREGMVKAAETASEAFVSANKRAQENSGIRATADELAAIQKTKAAYLDLYRVKNTELTRKLIKNIGGADSELSEADMAKLKERYTQLANSKRVTSEATKLEAEGIGKVISAYDNQLAVSARVESMHKDIDKSLVGRIKSLFDIQEANDRLAKKAGQRLTQANILSKLAQDLPARGFIQSFRDLNLAISNARKGQDELGKPLSDNREKLTKLGAAATYLKGGLGVVTQSVTTLANSLGGVLGVIGILITAWSMFNSFASKNAKEIEAVNASFDSLNDSALATDRVLDLISKKNPLAQISVESINARSNALNDLVSGLQKGFGDLLSADKMANEFDKWKDFVSKLWGGDLLTKSAKSFALAITKSLEVAEPSKEKTNTEEKLYNLLGVDPNDLDAVIRKLSESPDKIKSLMPGVNAILKQFGNEIGNMASSAKELDEAFVEANKKYDAVVFAAIPKDNLTELGNEFLRVSNLMEKTFEDPNRELSNLVSLAGDLSRLKFVDGGIAKDLLAMAPTIKKSATELREVQNEFNRLNELEREFLAKRKELDGRVGSRGMKMTESNYSEMGVGTEQLTAIKNAKALAAKTIEDTYKKLEPYLLKAREAQMSAFNRGAELIETSINQGFQKAGIIVSKAFASLLPSGSIVAAEEQARIAKEELSIQLQGIAQSKLLIQSQESLRRAVEEQTIMEGISALPEKLADPSKYGLTYKEIENLANNFVTRLKALQIVKSGRYEGEGSAGKVNTDRNSADPAEREAAKGYTATMQATSALNAKAAEISAQNITIELNKQANIIAANYTKQKEKLAVEASSLSLTIAENEHAQRNLAYLTDQELSQKQQRNNALALNRVETERLGLLQQADVQYMKLANPNIKETDKAAAIKALLELGQSYANAEARYSNEQRIRDIGYSNEKMANAKKVFDYEISLATTLAAIKASKEAVVVTLMEQSLARVEATGMASRQYVAEQTRVIEILKEEARYTEATRKAREDISKAEFGKKELTDSGVSDSDPRVRLLNAQIDAGNVILQNEKDITDAKKEDVKETEKLNKLYADQEDRMSTIKDLADSLSGAFGNVGSALGNIVNILGEAANRQERYANAVSAQQKVIDNVAEAERNGLEVSQEQYEEKSRAEKEIGKLTTKNTKQQINDNIAVLKSAKSLFKEKTGAYKVLDAAEKAMHAYKMAMLVKEVAMELWAAGQSIAASLSAMIVDGGAAVVKQGTDGDPYTAIPRMAAMAAFVAAIIASVGGSGGPQAAGGTSSADRQETQGTGQSWVDGRKVENGFGVFGDADAKSESIPKSLELMKETAVEGITYYSRMVELLESIDKGINNTAKDLYGVSGVRSGSMFGTIENTVSNKPFALASGLLTNKTTTSINDSGIILQGTFEQLAGLTEGAVFKFYEDVTTTTKKWYGKTKVNTTTNFSEMDKDITGAIEGIFANAVDLFTEVGSKIGLSLDTVMDSLSSVNVDQLMSLRGLKGEDFEKEFSAVISSILDQGSVAVFGEIVNAYKEFGEAPLETVIRVIDGADKVNQALFSIGDTTITLGQQLSMADITTSQALINMSGGLDEFISQTDFFRQNFLTEAQRLAPISSALGSELNRLSTLTSDASLAAKIAGVNTREGFADIVLGLNRSTEEGATLFSGLMNVADGFAEIYPEIEETKSSLADLQKEFTSLTDSLAKATMGGQAYREFARARDTKNSTPAEIAQYDTNNNLRDQIDIAKENGTIFKLSNDILRAQGKSQVALNNEREEELRLLPDAVVEARKLVHIKQDELSLAKLEGTLRATDIDLLKAQGKDRQALNLQRERELDTMSDAEKIIQKLIYARQDEIKLESMKMTLRATDVELLKAMGKDQEALNLQRERELDTMSDAEQVIQNLIYARQDEIAIAQEAKTLIEKYANTEIALLKAQGKDSEALAASRQLELDKLDPANYAIQRLIWAREDEISAMEAEKTAIENLKNATDGIVSGFNSAADGLESASNSVDSARQSMRDLAAGAASTISSILSSAKSNLESAQAATQAAREGISSQLFSAQDNLDSLLKQAADAANQASNDAKLALLDLGKSIKDFVKDLSSSELSGKTDKMRMETLRRQFEEEKARAKAGDVEALKNITDTAGKYLEISKTQSSSRLDFARTSGKVALALDEVANSALAKGAGATRDPISDLAQSIRDAQAKVDALMEAALVSGANTARTTEDLLAEYNAAAAAEAAASEEYSKLLIASKGIAEKTQSDVEKIREAVTVFETIKNALGKDFVGPAESVLKPLIEALDAQVIAQSVYDVWSVAVKQLNLEEAVKDSNKVALQTQIAVDALIEDYKKAKDDLADARRELSKALDYGLHASATILGTSVDGVTKAASDIAYSLTSVAGAIGSVGSAVANIQTYLSSGAMAAANDPTITVEALASGGAFKGGLRLVGEQGPELEVTGPSRIFSAPETANMLNGGNNNNAELIAEMRALRQEVASLRYSSERTEEYTKKTKDTLVRVTRDGNSFVTEAA